ncbi:MAG: pyridoxal-5-phosphate-dependent protein subunit beta [Candidatus Riflebacteria bacterium HGW-Riflebacteria-2]|jgi:cysteine synthase|nr:MAG: pyridoxal-5-phosphate-dependent protein subunit beta [Candidatus Riflebacteria bacterium HGW-Riflebacteria-2]
MLKVNEEVLKSTVQRAKERNIIIPTFAQQKNPELIPEKVKKQIQPLGLWDVDPRNLFRITWKNDIKTGLYGGVNYVELPSSLTGVKARIVGLVGKYFPTGAHKVGAAFGCLVPKLVSGEFDPTRQKAVWPSTGNYCRGGAYDCALLASPAIAILPQDMSPERFNWLKEIGTSEIFATPGCESNVKEIYDKCWELRKERGENIVIFNQFEEFGNSIWHYHLTGNSALEVYEKIKGPRSRLAGWVSATGSAGTIAAGDRIKHAHPHARIVASEALQCPTLLNCGFGGHRIEGIGDKHVPWIHNTRNTDTVVAVDDENCMRLFRVFNTPAGQEMLKDAGVSAEIVDKLSLMGISCISNVLSAVKTAKFYDLDENDILLTCLTDSAELYQSRLVELAAAHGKLDTSRALADFERYMLGEGSQNMMELTYHDRKRLHHFKYYTWVEQQMRDVEDLNNLWDLEFWEDVFSEEIVKHWDELIVEFNEKTGLLKAL